MNDFLPVDYTLPITSNYLKFLEGENPFRVLSSAIVGYQYFTSENKPVRSKEPFDIYSDIKKGGTVKNFWAFAVYNYNAQRIQILELTQKGIMKTMQAYIKNEKWGDPKDYDFIVNRTGSGMDTEYSVTVNPRSELDTTITDKYERTTINLEALYSNDDPFAV